TKYALKYAKKIITVSENTKKDLIKFYGGDENKIKVVHHGVELKFPISNSQFSNKFQFPISKFKIQDSKSPYLLCLGRIELKKNISGILKAFDIFKEKYKLPHKLILMGPLGYDYNRISKLKKLISKIKFCRNIIVYDYISETEKWKFLKNASIFLFPSLYEGFGLPILEAQAVGVPVITSDISSMPEVAGSGAILVDPRNTEEIAESIYKLIENREFRQQIINRGFENVKRFSWEKCARKTLRILVEN
ncbi:MAG: glycosyltransferase family 4 protein, partial [Spirochaetota bacterium]|nr:glycosyltransferase family 4 protein [Spirochaetota bacterium]